LDCSAILEGEEEEEEEGKEMIRSNEKRDFVLLLN
jgi:hypothetical protein